MKRKQSDPSDRAFFANLFTRIAEEMGATLCRTAYSPNIKERRDYSCAVFDGQGCMIAQAAHIPVHLGAMPMSVRVALNTFDRWDEGDVVLLNDPFAGGTHLPDLTMITPVFSLREKRPSAFLATRAHHADVGGMTPGSLPLSRDIYQEGLRLPPVKLYEKGAENRAVREIIKANVRTPDERIGDLRAQRASHEIGARRMREAQEKYGDTRLHAQMDDLLEYGEALMRAILKRVPSGAYAFEDVLDGDGVSDEPIRIRVTVRIRGGRARVDFTGSDPACAGSLNAVEAITKSAVYYCFLCLLATPSALHGYERVDPPMNAGCFRPIEVIAPTGTVVNAQGPHAVAGGNVETSQRIVDVVFGALAQALPEVIPAASQGTMNNLTLGGVDARTGRPFAYYETVGGGMGARPSCDGVDAVQVHMTNTMNTPIEALEFAYPFRVEKYAIAAGTGGKGRHRGGHGIRRDMRMLSDAHGALLTERRAHAPYGLQNGSAGKPGSNVLIRGGKRTALAAKVELNLAAGDLLSLRTPGGGGIGKGKGQ